ncbi:hypothetical protein GUITHDRAFT_120374 [Guillardia theta CCMP2712]|uniref:VPS10 domain-containing protein n=1 Tax=Guillardia theta (strain CCMP2712) TaxID=905079 RepID=L1IC57_GUITC|nr:hypothetical protein GUITHDRAFT_120374 [Guillardia theta CCMP2712]EKX33425.1 hypothetical protein GUITHDRAFT_120374 [Guillardia theta CCMP2712]|eukprot:XP_005820405.1 hypothetical protein GUITHDRAFT_120374 [Guillardia theta CCMP2712]
MMRLDAILVLLCLHLAPAVSSSVATCQSLGLRITEIELDGAVKDVVWLTQNVVFVLTEENTLYRSKDDGRTFENVMGELEDSEVQDEQSSNGVVEMYPSDADERRVFFKGGGKVHWVTYDRGQSFHTRRTEFPLGEIKLHKKNPDCLLVSRMSDVCLGLSDTGFCFNSLYVSYDWGTTFHEKVNYVQQFDWGPRDNTVVYSAYDDEHVGDQYFQSMKNLNLYRSVDMLRTQENIRLVVRHGVGFKVSQGGVYVAVAGEHGTMQLFVSRDDAQSFLPAVFPSELQETRYTIIDEDDGTVFVSVEHSKQEEGTSIQGMPSDSITVGDIYASVADGDVLFKDDFESGLTRWRGKHAAAVPSRTKIVDDPLCSGGSSCRGKVMKMTGCGEEGDAFSLESFTCSVSYPCKVSFWFLGVAWQGFSDGFPGRYIWSASGEEEKGVHHKVSKSSDQWTRVEYVFPRQHSEFVWAEGGRDAGRAAISRVHLMLQAHSSSSSSSSFCNATYIDDIRVTRARAEDYVMSLRDNTRDSVGHVDFHILRGPRGILHANVIDAENRVRTLRSVDNGNEWHPLEPPGNDRDFACEYSQRKGRWVTPTGRDCGLHLHMGHKRKGTPGRWDRRQHKEADERFGALVSNEKAVGIVIGVGNVGTELAGRTDEASTYVSRDAGRSWERARKGTSVGDIGDQGTILVLADNSEETNEISFSIDGGASFQTCSFSSDVELEVRDVLSDPSVASSNFLLHGSVPREEEAYFFSVDFSMLFPRQCSDVDLAGDPGSDFALWRPSGEKQDICVMGRQVDYVRRKTTARCFVGKENRLSTLVRNCPCQEADYECDFCYERAGEKRAALKNVSSSSCVWSCAGREKPTYPPANCLGTYTKTRGYRLVEGNTCQGGLDLRPQLLVCPRQDGVKNDAAPSVGGEGGSSEQGGRRLSWGGVGVGVVAVVAIGACAAASALFLKGRGIRGATEAHGYSRLSTGENDDFALADQDDYDDSPVPTPNNI